MLYFGNNLVAKQKDFRTMASGYISTNIVQIWCQIMSVLDMRRSIDQPKRVFFSEVVFMTLEKATNLQKSKSVASRAIFNNLCRALDHQLESISLDISDASLVFFSILRHQHFYLMCFNFMTSRLQVIDNRPTPERIKAKNKYEECPEKLLVAFTKYLTLKKNPLAKKMKSMKVEYMKMPWQNEENAVDFHEAYADLYRHVNSRLYTFLTSLRAKYAATILMSPMNTLLPKVTKATKEIYKQSK
ncbi:uncharacterized protein LOC116029840 [Ipomoea triloba]|uniref:uncharacterized protein LOC116029840 n=1 Tax=Ipomoea triloba TaxID=35885 RepID=UPI00125D432E|nr:uncharacterized protein LOC116029840 [Ipomoea triloba]